MKYRKGELPGTCMSVMFCPIHGMSVLKIIVAVGLFVSLMHFSFTYDGSVDTQFKIYLQKANSDPCTEKTLSDANSFLPADSHNSSLQCSKLYEVSPPVIELSPMISSDPNATVDATDDELLWCAARQAAMNPIAPGKPRVAFLFLVRGKIVFEPIWKRFFDGYFDMYSVYVHASDLGYTYPESSFFHKRNIPSKPVGRFSMTFVDAIRRLVAQALLDTAVPNYWFTLVCESTIPVRNFPFVYNYLINSQRSFVEAFLPLEWFRSSWNQEPEFHNNQTRKGEAWMTLHRRHAGLVVGESTLYHKFKSECRGVAPDEQYVQTMLALKDAEGIANRTVMYVDWSDPNHDSHPASMSLHEINSSLFQKIQQQTVNVHGMYQDSHQPGFDNEPSCTYDGSPYMVCFLFARKFVGGAEELEALQKLPMDVLGY